MNNTVKLRDNIQYFRTEAARHAWSMRRFKGIPVGEYYQGRYEALKHAAEYLALTVDSIEWRVK
jgi:hypothetical protein